MTKIKLGIYWLWAALIHWIAFCDHRIPSLCASVWWRVFILFFSLSVYMFVHMSMNVNVHLHLHVFVCKPEVHSQDPLQSLLAVFCEKVSLKMEFAGSARLVSSSKPSEPLLVSSSLVLRSQALTTIPGISGGFRGSTSALHGHAASPPSS